MGDRRLGERWTLTQRAKNALIYWAVRGALAVVDRLPGELLPWLGRTAGYVSHLLLQRARQQSQRALRVVLQHQNPKRGTLRCFVRAGENLALTLLLRRPKLAARDWVRIPDQDRDVLDRALSEGRGVVFVSAHLGPFEFIPPLIAELGHEPAIVVRESYDPRLDPVVDAHRRRRGIQVIHRGSPGASAQIVRALRRGQPVGFLMDIGGRFRGAPSVFLGWRVRMPVGPARIATRARCPLVVGTLTPASMRSTRLLGRSTPYLLRLVRIEAPDEPGMRQRIADELTGRIRTAYEHWLWMAPGFPWLRDDRASL